MRVGFIFNHARIVGGGEISFLQLIKAVRTHSVEPVVFVPAAGEVKERLKALDTEIVEHLWPKLNIRSLLGYPSYIKKTSELFRKHRLDLVHTNGARCMLYAGPAAKRADIPCVWHVRVLERDRLLDWYRSKYADRIIAISNSVADALADVIRKNQKPKVIYNGIDFSADMPALDLKEEFGVPEGPVILGVGRFTPWKGFDDLLNACARIKEKTPRFCCLLAGEALPAEKEYEKYLRELPYKLGLDNVYFAGWRQDLPAVMKSCTMLILPSHGEPFGRVIPEAWGCRLPVIATDAGGPAEIIEDGQTGLLIPQKDEDAIADAAAKLLADRDLAKRIAENAWRKKERFSLEAHAEKVFNIYKELV